MVDWWIVPVAFFGGVFVGTVILALAVTAGDWRD